MSGVLGSHYRREFVLAMAAVVALLIAAGMFLGFGRLLPNAGVGVNKAQAHSFGANQVLSYTTYLPFLGDLLPPYFDGFSDPASGWYVGPAMRYNTWCREDVGCFSRYEEVARLSYSDFEGGKYRFYVPLTWHGWEGMVDTWFVWPVQTAPLPEHYYPLPQNYCIETRGAFVNYVGETMQPYSAHWGIVFGANEGLSEVYTAQVNANIDYAMLRFHNYIYPGNRQPLDGTEVNVEIPIQRWTGVPNWHVLGTHTWNKLRVVVQGNHVQYYVNDHLVGNGFVPNMPRDHIGLIGGSWEVTPVDILIDYFKYEPNCTG
jgi:hypothetical protein